MPSTPTQNEPFEIYQDNGPFNPPFMREAVRTMFRTLPLDPGEPKPYSDRRMHAALLALSALHPRDEIEVMLGVQAMAAYHAAAACFHVGMNHHRPNGDSTRHVTAACSAARTFDTLLKALERRQAKPLAIPVGRPEPKDWSNSENPALFIDHLAGSVRADLDHADPPGNSPAKSPAKTNWNSDSIDTAQEYLDQRRIEYENEGLDIANTEGILPGGGMILVANPTPEQSAYIARRIRLRVQREVEENRRKGIKTTPKIRGIHTGDFIP